MANVVEIRIVVDNTQAIPAVLQTIASFDQLPTAISANTVALQQYTQQMNLASLSSINAEAAIQRTTNTVRQMGGHFVTSLDGVRLMSQELGVRLPRAMESVLSRVPAVTSAISGLMGGFIALGALEVFVRMGVQIWKYLKTLFDVNAAMRDFAAESGKTANARLFDESSLETSRALLQDVNEQMDRLEAKRRSAGADQFLGGFEQYFTRYEGVLAGLASGNWMIFQKSLNDSFYSKNDGEKQAEFAKQRIELQDRVNQMARAAHIREMEDEAEAQQQRLKGSDEIAARRANEHRLNIQRLADTQAAEQDRQDEASAAQRLQIAQGMSRNDPKFVQVYAVDQDAGKEQYRIAEKKADEDAASATINLSREVATAQLRAHDEVLESALEGEALADRKRMDAIDEMTRSLRVEGKAWAIPDQIKEENAKYENERLLRIQKLEDETRKLAGSSARVGLSGVGADASELSDRLADIEDARKKSTSPEMTDSDRNRFNAAYDQQRVAAQQELAAKREKIESDYNTYVQEQIAQRTDAELSSMGKVAAKQAEEHLEAQKRYADQFVVKDTLDPTGKLTIDLGSNDDRAKLAEQNAAIDKSAAMERQQLEQQIHEQTLQMDREALAAEAKGRNEGLLGWADKYRDTVAEIEAQHAAMVAKIDAEEKRPGVTQNAYAEYQRQKVDADAKANAEIEDANQQLARSIAGTLESAFDSPLKTIQKKFEKMAIDIAANWLAHSGVFGSVPGAPTPGNPSGAPPDSNAGGLMHLFGGFAGFGQTTGFTPTAGQSSAAQPAGTPATSSPLQSAPQAAAYRAAQQQTHQSGFAASPIGTAMQALGFYHPHATSTGAATGFATGAISGATPGPTSSLPAPIAAQAAQQQAQQAAAPPSAAQVSASEFAAHAATSPSSAESSVPAAAQTQVENMAKSTQPDTQAASALSAASSVSSLTGTVANTLPAGSNAASAASSAAGVVGAGVGAYSGFMGVEASFESGKASGILSGATSGATMGASVGSLFGPEGAAVGGLIGAAAGGTAGLVGWASGEGGRLGAANYYKNTMLPQMEQAEQAYGQGGGTATAALTALDSVVQSGMSTIGQKFGASAEAWVRDSYVTKEQKVLSDEINRMAGAGKDYTATAAVQFHAGGTITGFGDLATSGNEGFIHAMLGEKVANTFASSTHGSYIDAMNSGASESDVAAMYMRNAGAGSGSGGDTHYHDYGDVHISAIDSNSFEDFLGNRGGMDTIAKMQNQRNTQYGGDGY